MQGRRDSVMRHGVAPCSRSARHPVVYSATMRGRWETIFGVRRVGWLALVLLFAACSSKTIQYPEDHERFRRIDQAVEALREAYQTKDRSRFESLMLPLDPLEQLHRDAEADFEAFHSIALDFKTERIMIEGDDVDVYVHWQGVWKRDSEDAGIRQRGHARLQWVGTHSILLRGVQGDLPFGMRNRQTISDSAPARPGR